MDIRTVDVADPAIAELPRPLVLRPLALTLVYGAIGRATKPTTKHHILSNARPNEWVHMAGQSTPYPLVQFERRDTSDVVLHPSPIDGMRMAMSADESRILTALCAAYPFDVQTAGEGADRYPVSFCFIALERAHLDPAQTLRPL